MNYPKNRYTGEKPWMDKEWLYNEYVTKDRATYDIANEYGCKQNTIQQWLRTFGIKKPIKRHTRRDVPEYSKYENLYECYVVKEMTASQIAEKYGVSYDTIRVHLIDVGLFVPTTPHKPLTSEQQDDIVRLYTVEKLSTVAIGKMYGISARCVRRCLIRHCVDRRNLSEATFLYNGVEKPHELLDRDFLYKEHWENGRSCTEIAEELGVDPGTVRRNMHSMGLRTRNNSESKIGIMCGEKHPNWKGGVTPLVRLLREFCKVNISAKVFKRDGYVCQMCGKKTAVLHAHHIIPFSEIVKTICDENSQLSPSKPNEAQILYDIITKDERFLDTDNLITLCRDCHLFVVHGYTRNKTISNQASEEEGSETIPNGSTSQANGDGSARVL